MVSTGAAASVVEDSALVVAERALSIDVHRDGADFEGAEHSGLGDGGDVLVGLGQDGAAASSLARALVPFIRVGGALVHSVFSKGDLEARVLVSTIASMGLA